MSAPIVFRWSGEAMEPLPRFARLCDRLFTVGEMYRQETIEERSLNTHNHYFAALNEAWRNLPEDQSERFPNPEKLRKWCLIRAGYSDQRSIVCASKAEAQRIAAFMRPMDEYAIVIVSEAVVTVYTAQSQSMKAMGAKVFQESKQRVLDICAQLIGVEPETLAAQAGKAA